MKEPTMNIIEIGQQKYDLNLAEKIMLSKTSTMLSNGEDVYHLAFPEGECGLFNPIELSEMKNKEEIYKKYLEVNPHKWIRFDGCCFE